MTNGADLPKGQVADAVKGKRYAWKDYGGTHPKKFGYQVASSMIGAAIEAGLEKAGEPGPHQVKAPMESGSYDNGAFVPVDKAMLSGDGWKIGKVGKQLLPAGQIRPQYADYQVLRGDQPGAKLTLEFVGRSIGAFILAGPDAGVVEVSIDGGDIQTHDLYHRHSARLNYPRSVMFATDLEPKKHELRLKIADHKNEKSKGHGVSILFFEVNGALNAKDIESIARQAVSENDTWVNQAEFDEPKRKNDGSGWSVLVWRLPKTPGGHRSIEIDPNGKVIAYHRGR